MSPAPDLPVPSAVPSAIQLPPGAAWPFPPAAENQTGEAASSQAAAPFDGAVEELLQLRRDVQFDARRVLRVHMGGDVGDGRLHKDLGRVAARLVKAAGMPREAVQVFIGNSLLPNAFTMITKSESTFIQEKASAAKPFRVANVFLSLGLLRALETEEQLAFVIAHEINHNWKEHLKGFAGSHEMLGHFHEFEADAEGLKLMARAGYDPKQALDSLYALDKANERLAKDYALFSRRDKGELAKALERIRDVHPHKDLRRANMLDHLDEALELYKPVPVPAAPLWRTLRQNAARPSALDRFERRVRAAAIVEGSVDARLHSLEAFIEKERSKKAFSLDERAIIEEAYRDILKGKPDFEGTRAVDLSIRRGQLVKSQRLDGQLVSRQLELLLKSPAATLEDLLHSSGGMAAPTLLAGTLRKMGQVKTRRELEAMYRALTHGAENLGWSPRGAMKDNLPFARRLWRSTGRVLSAELGRSARPEEIIEEIRAKLSPALLRYYQSAFHVLILESCMEEPARRSEKYAPSQLIMRLMNLDDNQRQSLLTDGAFSGLVVWGSSHYTPGDIEVTNDRIVASYERYHVAGLSSPSLRDFLDITQAFVTLDGTIPPALVRMLKRDNRFEAYMLAELDRLEQDLLAHHQTESQTKAAVVTYVKRARNLMSAALHGVWDLTETARIAALIWGRARKTHAALKAFEPADAAWGSEANSQFADGLLSTITASVRVVLARLNQAGRRPSRDDLTALADVTRSIEETLELQPSRQVVAHHTEAVARPLGTSAQSGQGSEKNLRDYMTAFKAAFPMMVLNTKPETAAHNFFARHAPFFTDGYDIFLPLVKEARSWVAAKAARFFPYKTAPARPLRPSDMLHLLLMSDDLGAKAVDLAAAAALADKLPFAHDGGGDADDVEKKLSLFASHAIGRWLLESAVAAAQRDGDPGALVNALLRLNDYQPGLLNPNVDPMGSIGNGFREGAAFVRRNEPYLTLARQEHPFRGVNSRWGERLIDILDASKSWPASLADRLDLLDLINASGEFSDKIDERIIAQASAKPAAFREWIKMDGKRLKRLGGGDLSEKTMSTPLGAVAVPKAAPLRIVRNMTLRPKLFDLTEASKLSERPPRPPLRERYETYKNLYRRYKAARRYFSAKFLLSLSDEGSLEAKFFLVLEELDRIGLAKSEEWRRRWDREDFTLEEKDREVDGGVTLPAFWREGLPHEKAAYLKSQRLDYEGQARAAIYDLYLAFVATQEPVLAFLLNNYPEPTRSRDALLERVMKARRLTPGGLSLLEANKSYRQPNPIRVAEKHLLDQAVVYLGRFDPADRVDLILYMAGLSPLSPERLRELDHKFLTGDRKKLAAQRVALRSISQLKGYMSLLHPRDRALLVRGLFFGEDLPDPQDAAKKVNHSLNSRPSEVERLHEAIVIKDRKLPKFLEEVFRAEFRALNDDEKAVELSNLAASSELAEGGALDGPEVLRIALKGKGVIGAKVAQVLAAHRGLVPDEYADALESFKDRAQNIGKVPAYELMKERLERILPGLRKVRELDLDEVVALADKAVPEEGEAVRRRLARQVHYILSQEGKAVRRIDFLGAELGGGSIKVVYKVELKDDRGWFWKWIKPGKTFVIKIRAPGASYKSKRDFEIVEATVDDLEKSGSLDLPGARQLLDEVRSLVEAEMDFRDEAVKENGVRDRARARPWYARLLVGPTPYVPKPHAVYQGEDLLIEEFVPTTRFADLPERSLLGPSRRSVARRTIDEGTFALVHDEWLEPDAHTGNRYARKGLLDRVLTRLVMIDLGQGQSSPVERLKPLLRAGLALESGDVAAASSDLIATLSPGFGPTKVRAAVEDALAQSADIGILERLMKGYLAAEKSGAIVKPEYAALQKAFLIYGGYSRYLPHNEIYASLERAVAARMLKDGKLSVFGLARLSLKRFFLGRAAVRAELAALIDQL